MEKARDYRSVAEAVQGMSGLTLEELRSPAPCRTGNHRKLGRLWRGLEAVGHTRWSARSHRG